MHVQAAIVIFGHAILSFDYSGFHFYNQIDYPKIIRAPKLFATFFLKQDFLVKKIRPWSFQERKPGE